jgi:hypothetical protein
MLGFHKLKRQNDAQNPTFKIIKNGSFSNIEKSLNYGSKKTALTAESFFESFESLSPKDTFHTNYDSEWGIECFVKPESIEEQIWRHFCIVIWDPGILKILRVFPYKPRIMFAIDGNYSHQN